MLTRMRLAMSDEFIRNLFGLDDEVDLDRPLANLEFMSYREAAKRYADKWGEELES